MPNSEKYLSLASAERVTAVISSGRVICIFDASGIE